MRTHRLGVYRSDRGTYLIEIRLRELKQLFNTLDPSPFHERDLDPAAEEYLVSAAREVGARPSKLVLHLPAPTSDEEAVDAVTAIRHYFEYRSRHTRQQLRLLLGRGAISLLIGLTFLGACLLLRQVLVGASNSGVTIVSEGLLILGWVAMWRPVEVFLYDWWPELGRRRLFDRIAHMQIETETREAAGPSRPEIRFAVSAASTSHRAPLR
ncbi:MAG TPA: hypothetical protein VJT80_04695 [Steroidobacteraceae bacterium]|nr:hypothetical protein [Steroidobacteraceae bacterium]